MTIRLSGLYRSCSTEQDEVPNTKSYGSAKGSKRITIKCNAIVPSFVRFSLWMEKKVWNKMGRSSEWGSECEPDATEDVDSSEPMRRNASLLEERPTTVETLTVT